MGTLDNLNISYNSNLMQSVQNLSKEEKNSFQRAVNLFLPDEGTRTLAIEYYMQFRSNALSVEKGKLDYYFKCAFFVSEKSQYLYNVKGQRIKGITFSINQIIKSCPNMQEMLNTIHHFIKNIQLPDQDVKEEIDVFLQMLEVGSQFAAKFEKAFKKFNLQQKVDESFGYKSTFVSFAWLLFIDAKSFIFDGRRCDYAENTCLLVAVCYFMIRYSIDYIRPSFLAKMIQNQLHKKTMIAQLIETLLNMFLVSDIQTYKGVAKSFDDYVENLLHRDVIKYSNQKSDFLSPTLININYKRLDTSYQKRLDQNTIDERMFLNNRVSTLSPSKYTPIEKHKLFGKKQTIINSEDGPNKKNFASHRILNYDATDSTPQAVSPMKPRNEARLPVRLLSPPIFKKAPLLCTPVMHGMEAHNYVNKKARIQKKIIHRSFFKVAQSLVNEISESDPVQDRNSKSRNLLTLSFYRSICEDFFQRRQETESYHRCLLSFSIYIVNNLNNQDNANFFDVVYQLEPDVLDLWTVCHFLAKFDSTMPKKIKSQLTQIEYEIICSELWKDECLIEEIAQLAANFTTCESLEKAVGYVLKYSENQINMIRKYLGLSYQVASQAFNCIKYFLSSDGQTFYRRHIDQIILCSMYVAVKACSNVKGYKNLFNELIIAHEKTNHVFKTIHQEIVGKVYMEGKEPVNIIGFYNQAFIPAIRPFIKFMQSPSIQALHKVFHCPIAQIDTMDGDAGQQMRTNRSQSKLREIPMNRNDTQRVKGEITHRPLIKTASQQDSKLTRVASENQMGMRNETRIRTRPPTLNINFLCDTQKGRHHKAGNDIN